MAQKAHFVILAAALLLPGTAPAHEHRGPERHAPIVLNGRLNTADFTGGVGYSSGGTYYIQGYSYGFANSGSSSFAGTQGFVAGARASAFAAASASAGTGGHR